MNQSYLNGPLHELAKQFRPKKKLLLKFIHRNIYAIYMLRYIYCYIRYLWSIPDGPVFVVKLWMLILDRLFGRLYSLNQNPICRSPNHSSVLSKNQNIGQFLQCSVQYIIYITVVCLKSGLVCVRIFGDSPDFLVKSCF